MIHRFFTFEGIDGCGKTTQLALLTEWLKSREIKFLLTREPGGSAIGEQIRQVLLCRETQIDPTAELLLYSADRAHHVRQVIRPALASGMVVLSDRFADATTAYQGYGRGLSLELIEQLHQIATDGLWPLKTFFLDLDVELAQKRVLQKRGEADRLELESINFHNRVRNGYLRLVRAYPERFVVIDASQPSEKTHLEIVNVLQKYV